MALMGPQQRRADSDGLEGGTGGCIACTLMPGHPDSGCEVQVNMQENMREYAGKNQMGSDHGEPNRHFEGLSLLFVHTKLPSFRLSIRCDLAMGQLLA